MDGGASASLAGKGIRCGGSLFTAASKGQQQSGPDKLTGPAGPVSDLGGGFYSDLFQAREVDPVQAGVFLDCLEARLSPVEQAALEGDLTLEEVGEAMMSLQKGKVPGGDGLPIEFYLALWPQLGPDLLQVYGEALGCGLLPASMRTGLISLIFKKGGCELAADYFPGGRFKDPVKDPHKASDQGDRVGGCGGSDLRGPGSVVQSEPGPGEGRAELG